MRTSVLFSHHLVSDPFTIYEERLRNSPVFYAPNEKIWGVYSYDSCLRVLQASDAWIPEMPQVHNPAVDILVNGLARLANGTDHEHRREIVTRLFAYWQPPDITQVLDDMFENKKQGHTCDWVATVGARLPAMTLLKGFQLQQYAIEQIISALPGLVKLMNPVKTRADVNEITGAHDVVLKYAWPAIVNSGLANLYDKNLLVSNFIGLLIQGYDSGIGCLCNVLIQYIKQNYPPLESENDAKGFVRETFRYAPPFHNTRRVIKMPLQIDSKTLEVDDTVVVFLAAANRDRTMFVNPGEFNSHRANAIDALTFGSGPHACVARSFSETLGCALVNYLLHNAVQPELIDQTIVYQNKVNARIPASLIVRL